MQAGLGNGIGDAQPAPEPGRAALPAQSDPGPGRERRVESAPRHLLTEPGMGYRYQPSGAGPGMVSGRADDLTLVAGIAGGILHTGLFFVPALVALTVGGVKLWREQP